MATSLYNGHHQHLLFHWVASSSDRRAAKYVRGTPQYKAALTDEMRNEYLTMLDMTLTTGLWHRTPEKHESVSARFKGEVRKVESLAKLTCFTEWPVEDSLKHALRYGRLGFGFPKRWVLARGGQPVTYFKAGNTSRFTQAVVSLHEIAERGENARLKEDLRLLLNFVKPVSLPARPRGGGAAKPAPPNARAPARAPAPPRPNWGRSLPLLEEREWRIADIDRVVSDRFWEKAPDDKSKNFIPFHAGSDLFTVVLPDERTRQMLTCDRFDLLRRLTPADVVPVRIRTLDEAG